MSVDRFAPWEIIRLVAALRGGRLLVGVADAVELQRLLRGLGGSSDEALAHAVGYLIARDSVEHERAVGITLAWVQTRRQPVPPLGPIEQTVGWGLVILAMGGVLLGWPLSHDGDGDGHLWRVDCDDLAADVHLGGAERCDERDEDCDGEVDELDVALDQDGDGAPGAVSVCRAEVGEEPAGWDCDDADAGVHPGAPELCDGRDEDCSGVVDDAPARFLDRDGDGVGVQAEEEACSGGVGWWADVGGDCDAADPAIHPGAVDAPGDGVDQDCDGCDGACAPECASALRPPELTQAASGWEQVLLLAVALWAALHHLLPRTQRRSGEVRSAEDLLSDMEGPRAFGLGPHDVPGPVSDAVILATARALRSLDQPGARLDVARTVEATARERRPELRFLPQRGRARLLVLVDDAPRTRAWGPRVDSLLHGLQDRGVELEVWRFVRSPLLLRRGPASRPTALAALREEPDPVQISTLLQAARGWWVTVISAGEEDLPAGALWWPALENADACWLSPVEGRRPRVLQAGRVPVFDMNAPDLLRWARWLRTRDTAASRSRRAAVDVTPAEIEALVWVAGLLPDGDAARAVSILRCVQPGTSSALFDAARGLPLGLDSELGRQRHRAAARRLEGWGLLAELELRVREEIGRRIAEAEPEEGSPAWLRWRLWRGWVWLGGDAADGRRGQAELLELARSPIRGEVGGWLDRTSGGWAGRDGPIRTALAGPMEVPPGWGPPPRWSMLGIGGLVIVLGGALPRPAPVLGVERVAYAWQAAEGGFTLSRTDAAAPDRVRVVHDGVVEERSVGEVRAEAVGCWEAGAEARGVLWRSDVVGAPQKTAFVQAVVRAVNGSGEDLGEGVALVAAGRLDELDLTGAPGLLRRVRLGEPAQIAVGSYDVLAYADGGLDLHEAWSPGDTPNLNVKIAFGGEGDGCLVFAEELGSYVLPTPPADNPPVSIPVPTGVPVRASVGDVVRARAWQRDVLVDLPATRVPRGPGCATITWDTPPARCQVSVQYAGASARPAATRVQRALRSVCEVADGLDDKPGDGWGVRYFHAEDRADAERVRAVVRAQAGVEVGLEDASGAGWGALGGQIEVWVGAAASESLTGAGVSTLEPFPRALAPAEIRRLRAAIDAESPAERGDRYEALQTRMMYLSERDCTVKENGELVESAGGRTSSMSSLAMALSILGIENPDPSNQFDDSLELLRQRKGFAPRTTSAGWGAVARELGADVEFISTTDFQEERDWWETHVRPALRAGNGVMLGITGHIVRVEALSEQGLVVDDPYGRSVLGRGTERSFSARNPYQSADGPAVGDSIVWPWSDVGAHTMHWVAAIVPREEAREDPPTNQACVARNPGRFVEEMRPSKTLPDLVMVSVTGGDFCMGSPEGEPGRGDDEHQHNVTVRAFSLGQTEVTQGQWQAVMRRPPAAGWSRVTGRDARLPAYNLTWYEAVDFLNRLSDRDGLEPCYDIPAASPDARTWERTCTGYRLPTEAEWEYAARAGTTDRYPGTDDSAELCAYANVFSCGSTEGLVQVASLKSNPWRLYDMGGNVAEWVWDWYAEDLSEEAVDRGGPPAGSRRVFRGGWWDAAYGETRVGERDQRRPSNAYDRLGFRPARSVPSTL